MSTHTECSIWSPQEVDSLENIDKEVQLVSTSTESHSTSNQENGSGGKTVSHSNKKRTVRQSLNILKLHSSCDDLSVWGQDNKLELVSNQNKGVSSINHSNTFVNLKINKNTNSDKCNHAQTKIKDLFSSTSKMRVAPTTLKSEMKEDCDKEDYLEEINKQLTKELDEKNAILSLLQENYEHLLFKYAEAQNRIDELRFKFMTDKPDSKDVQGFQSKHNVIDNQISSHFPCTEEYPKVNADVKCQKAVVAPFIKINEPEEIPHTTPSRPSSLPLDSNLKYVEKDLLKTATPTDSEGLSSIITSMSGHSKILNSLDEENQMNKKPNLLKYPRNSFILEENTRMNDPFDKVKNWQNSLPPLEQIETPETALYNVFPNGAESFDSPSLNHKDASPKTLFSEESCPASWREEPLSGFHSKDSKTQRSKNSPRPLSLPNSCTKQNKMSKKSNHSLETCRPEEFHENFRRKENASQNVLSCSVQRRKKRPPLLRCSSLPSYHQDNVRSGNFKNGIYIPPLDLGNMTLSDDESYCQQDYYPNKSNVVTSSSFATSSVPQSFSSCKATISEENSRVPRSTVDKSTSITPERSRTVDLPRRTGPCLKECTECCTDTNRCNVCGESFLEDRRWLFRDRSNSCESVHGTDVHRKEMPLRRSKPPFTRSVSFGSETNTPKYCSHEKATPRELISELSQESLENFETYARNLKARSQVVIKALAAHVNNS